jgi:TPR repeat protein
MVSLASARAIFSQDQIIAAKDGLGVLQIAIGMEAYLLCPESAVEYYVMAAQLGNQIAMYNLAMIKLEANTKEGKEQAIEWLQKAANLGDSKAKQVRLELTNQRLITPRNRNNIS